MFSTCKLWIPSQYFASNRAPHPQLRRTGKPNWENFGSVRSHFQTIFIGHAALRHIVRRDNGYPGGDKPSHLSIWEKRGSTQLRNCCRSQLCNYQGHRRYLEVNRVASQTWKGLRHQLSSLSDDEVATGFYAQSGVDERLFAKDGQRACQPLPPPTAQAREMTIRRIERLCSAPYSRHGADRAGQWDKRTKS